MKAFLIIFAFVLLICSLYRHVQLGGGHYGDYERDRSCLFVASARKSNLNRENWKPKLHCYQITTYLWQAYQVEISFS